MIENHGTLYGNPMVRFCFLFSNSSNSLTKPFLLFYVATIDKESKEAMTNRGKRFFCFNSAEPLYTKLSALDVVEFTENNEPHMVRHDHKWSSPCRLNDF
jgi:hypothetical protein